MLNNKYYSSQAIILIGAMLLFIAPMGCLHSQKSAVTEVYVVSVIPVNAFKKEGKVQLFNITDSTTIFYFKEYTLYKLQATVQFETNENIQGTEPYFLLRNGDSTGAYFTSIKDSACVKLNADSLLRKKNLKGLEATIPVDSIWKLTHIDSTSREIVETYTAIQPHDEYIFDTIYYYYSRKMNGINFSLSEKLDNIRGMKLYKTRLIYKAQYWKEQQFIIPQREISFCVTTATAKNPERIISLLEHFESLSLIKQIKNGK